MPRTARPSLSRALVPGAILAVAACAAGPEPTTSPSAAVAAHDSLDATLWTQTSAEFFGATLQAYRQAEIMLERGLGEPGWSAALEQLSDGGFEGLPPAVILDVDETVLDNSAYQARLILDGAEYGSDSWNDWVREEQATPIPGALEFTRAAAERGVAVFYVTNRRHLVEEATRRNLESFGFPLTADEDRLLTRDERPDWTGDKGTRRRHVAADYRIVLLVGDNLGDFASDIEVSPEERDRVARERAALWGTRWIVLPNPQYGSWEGSLHGFRYDLAPGDRRALKRAALEALR